MATMTPTTNVDLIPLILAQRALGALRGNTRMAKFVAKDTDYGSTFTVGRTLDIAARGVLTAVAKVPGTPVTFQAPATSKVSLTLSEHMVVPFTLEDITAAVEQPDAMMGYAEDAGVKIAESLETYLGTFVNNFSQTAGTAGVDLIETAVLEAKRLLTTGKAPESNRGLFISPKDEKSLLQVDRFVSAYALGSPAQYQGRTVEGSLGRIAGFDVFVSQYLETTAGPTVHNAAMHRDALTLAVRRLPDVSSVNAKSAFVIDSETGMVIRTTMSYDAANMGVSVVIDSLYGAVETRDVFGVDLLS